VRGCGRVREILERERRGFEGGVCEAMERAAYRRRTGRRWMDRDGADEETQSVVEATDRKVLNYCIE